MLTLSTAGANALLALSTPITVLVEMQTVAPLYLNISGWDFDWNGHTWLGTKSFGAIEPVEHTTAEARGLKFQLSGVPTDLIALALGEDVQGKACNVYVAVLDPATYQITDALLEWAGRLDTLSVAEDGDSATIQVTAEHAGIDLLRPAPLRYSDADQQRLFPGDKGLEFVNDSAETPIVWPAASFFRQ